MDIIPADAAEDLKKCTIAAGNSTANERFGSQGEADAEKVHWNQYADSFKKKVNGFLSADTCNDLKSMFWYQAWRTANERKGYKSDAASDIKTVEEKYQKIVQRGELSKGLASNVHSMGWNIAWYCANTLYGYDDDAKRDKAKYEDAYSKISGEINLVDMKFRTDASKILSEKPKVVAEQRLVNNSGTEQSMEFDFAVTEGTTNSTSHQIGFKYGIKTGFEAGFFGIAEAKYEVSFEFSHNHTFSESTTKGTTKTYKFPLKVPPHSTYVAKGMVHEAEMEVPYDLVFDFGGTRKTISGIWKGVAVSTATYEVNQQ